MKLFRYLLLSLLLTASVTAISADLAPRSAEQYFFDESFWDLSEEIENAQEQGKQGILIMFEMDECPFCHRMKTTILNQRDVQEFFKNNFIILPIDIEGDIEITNFKGDATTMKDFAFKEYRVRATPVFAFYTPEGKYIKRARYTGATRDKAEFMLLGRYVSEKHYLKQSFSRYKRSQP